MAGSGRVVIGGVDTHGSTHHAAAIDVADRVLAAAQLEANSPGYRGLHSWLRGHGELSPVGVKGTGSYGAGLAHYLSAQGDGHSGACPAEGKTRDPFEPPADRPCAAMSTGQTRLGDPVQGTKAALRSLSRRGSAGEPCAVQGCDRAPGA